ncbi:MAG TPA: aldo/keto reductase [Kofleriaceae bacterium]|nr:aldo/keto reductase [Kofleriaceae bacterium]
MWSRSTLPVGSGDVSVSRAVQRGLDAGDVTRALHDALLAGIDLVDVAPEEPAERLVGEVIRTLRLRDRVVVACRVPAIGERHGAPTRDTLPERLPPRYLQERVESALRTTRLEVLPLAQLGLRAAWRSSSAWPELAGTCARLVREGKVLDWGALVDEIEDDTAELAHEPWLATLSVPFSLCERAAERLLEVASGAAPVPAASPAPAPAAAPPISSLILSPFDIVQAAEPAQPASAVQVPRITVLARRPLAGGALAGTLGPGAKLRATDDRRTLDDRTLERIAVAVAKLAAFTKQVPAAARSCDAAKLQLEQNRRPDELHASTVAELALRYAITRGAIALPRLHRREHVAEAVAAAHAPPLPQDLVEKLDI